MIAMAHSPNDLAQGFPASTDAQWRSLVDKVLKGADFEKRLVRTTLDGIKIQPLYRAGPTGVDAGVAPQGAGTWDIRARVIETTAQAARTTILDELKGGVTSIALQIAAPGQIGLPVSEIEAALEGVELDAAGIAFEASANAVAAAAALKALWSKRGLPPAKVFGSFAFDPIGTLARTGVSQDGIAADLKAAGQLLADARGFAYVSVLRADGTVYHRAGASEAQELAAVLATVVAYLRAAEAQGVAPKEAWTKIDVRLAVDADQVLGLAKLRAARRLLNEIAAAVGAADVAGSMILTAETAERMFSQRDAWTNMLRSTLAVATAAMGGAQVITTLPHTHALGQADGFARRIARNIHHVLAEESALGRVADPAGGSFAIESLTDELARTAWGLFQEIEKGGGIVAALTSGALQKQIAAAAEKRARDIATGRIELTGSSTFPKLGDDGIAVASWPAAAAIQPGAL
ncbi:MAG: hypothetical protein RL291_178, partial [Pseudomonadota bacterium]